MTVLCLLQKKIHSDNVVIAQDAFRQERYVEVRDCEVEPHSQFLTVVLVGSIYKCLDNTMLMKATVPVWNYDLPNLTKMHLLWVIYYVFTVDQYVVRVFCWKIAGALSAQSISPHIYKFRMGKGVEFGVHWSLLLRREGILMWL